MPDLMAETILAYLGEQRSFSYLVVTPAQLDGDAPTPTEDVLRGFHAENGDSYTIPETREITYAALRPADLASGVEVCRIHRGTRATARARPARRTG